VNLVWKQVDDVGESYCRSSPSRLPMPGASRRDPVSGKPPHAGLVLLLLLALFSLRAPSLHLSRTQLHTLCLVLLGTFFYVIHMYEWPRSICNFMVLSCGAIINSLTKVVFFGMICSLMSHQRSTLQHPFKRVATRARVRARPITWPAAHSRAHSTRQ